MRINGYNDKLQGNAPLNKKPEGAQKQPAAPGSDKDGDVDVAPRTETQGEDSIEISANAQKFLVQGQGQQKAQTPVRPEAVERAKQVLQSGLYNDSGVLDKTASAIMGREFAAEA